MDPVQAAVAALLNAIQAAQASGGSQASPGSALASLAGKDITLLFQGTAEGGLTFTLPSGQTITAQGNLTYPEGTRLTVRVAPTPEGGFRLQTLQAQPPAGPAILAPLAQGEAQVLLARLTAPEPAPELGPLVQLFRQLAGQSPEGPQGQALRPAAPGMEGPGNPQPSQQAGQQTATPQQATPQPALPPQAAPQQAAPQQAAPQQAAPQVASPQPGAPQQAAPQPAMPQPGAPQQAAPQQAAPQQAAPQPAAPQPAAPQQAAPPQAAPPPAAPPSAAPPPAAPQQTTPQQAAPQQAAPQQAAPQPSMPQPAVPQQAASQPAVLQPGVPQPVSSQPGTPQPAAPTLAEPSPAPLLPSAPGLPSGPPANLPVPGNPDPASLGWPSPGAGMHPPGMGSTLAGAPAVSPGPKELAALLGDLVQPEARALLRLLQAGRTLEEVPVREAILRLQASLPKRGEAVVPEPLVQALKTLARNPEALPSAPAEGAAVARPAAALPESWEAWIRGGVRTLGDPAASPREAPFHLAQAREGTAYFELPLPWAPQAPLQMWVERDRQGRGRGEEEVRVLLGLSFTRLGETRLGIRQAGGGLQVRLWAQRPGPLEAARADMERELAALGRPVDLKILPLDPDAPVPSIRALAAGSSFQALG